MAYTTPCFIRKNTKELRNKLYQQGRPGRAFTECEHETILIAKEDCYTTDDFSFGKDGKPIYAADVLIKRGYIDCGVCEELFLAISALRDDTDDKQWYTDGGEYWQQVVGAFKYRHLAYKRLHKATVEELITHFTTNNRES